MTLVNIHQFLYFLAHVISKHSEIGYEYNFLNYLAFCLLYVALKQH